MLPQTVRKLERHTFILAGGFLCFVSGIIAAYFELPPYHMINDAVLGHKALEQRDRLLKSAGKPLHVIQQEPPDLMRKPGAYEGLTLFNTFSTSDAYLVDMDGKIVYHWGIRFSDIWPDHPQVSHPVNDAQVCFFGARVFPNGDLLATFEGRKDVPWGYGLARIDKNSHLLWRYTANTNHTFDIAPDGRIYALNQKIQDEKVEFLPAPLIANFLVVLSPEGKEIESVPLLEALVHSPYSAILKKKYGLTKDDKQKMPRHDYLHTNSTHYLTPEMAKAFPMFKAGQILVSFRNINTIAVLDLPRRKIVWAAQGPWKAQHDARFVADGTIIMLDNKGLSDTQSRILKYNPATRTTSTFYQGSKDAPFFTGIRGMLQPLPNGDVLITEADKGRLFEVTAHQDIVWEMIDPYHTRGGKENPIVVTTGLRYRREDLPFLNGSGKPK